MAILSRIILILLLLTAAVFGAVNGSMIELDFVWTKWTLPLGVALLGFLVFGALLGAAFAYLAFVPRLKAQLKKRVENKAV